MKITPQLPSQKQLEKYLWDDYLFVWRDARTRERKGWCTHCKSTVSLELGRTYTNEEYANTCKKHNDIGFCLHCKSAVIFKDKNRGRKQLIQEKYLHLIQPLKNGGIIYRTMFLMRDFSEGITNLQIEISEHNRIYFINGKILRYKRESKGFYYYFRKDYFRLPEQYFVWTNIKSLTTPSPFAAYGMYRGEVIFDYALLNKSRKQNDFKYLNFSKLIAAREYKAIEILSMYYKHPALFEKLYKENVLSIWLDTSYCKKHINWKATTVSKALGLNRAEMKQLPLRPCANDVEYLKLLRMFSNEQQKKIKSIKQYEGIELMSRAAKYSLRNKIVKYVFTLAKEGVYESFMTYISDYFDYVSQLNLLNIEINKSTLFPQHFSEAHQQLIDIINKKRDEEELKKYRQAESNFKKYYEQYKIDLCFESENFLIRPAAGVEELLNESSALHHCVYRIYCEKYLNAETIILFIRNKQQPDEPYYTLELSKDYMRIIQCRGKGNCGQTAEISKFVEKWHYEIIRRKENKRCQKTA